MFHQTEVNCKECLYYYITRSNEELCRAPQDHIDGTIPDGWKLCKYNRLKGGCGQQGNWYKGVINDI